MTTISELEKKLSEIQSQINEMKIEAAEPEEWPKVGDKYLWSVAESEVLALISQSNLEAQIECLEELQKKYIQRSPKTEINFFKSLSIKIADLKKQLTNKE